MIGGDVVSQNGKRSHVAQRAFARKRALPIGWTTNVGAGWAPLIERVDGACFVFELDEHWLVHACELLGFNGTSDDRINFLIAWPDIAERDGLAIRTHPQRISFDVKAHGSSDGIGNHQRRRREERLFGIGVDTTIKITVTRENGSRVQVPVDHLLLNDGVKGAAHAVTGRAGKSDNPEAKCLELG